MDPREYYPQIPCPPEHRDEYGSPLKGMPEYLPTPHRIYKPTDFSVSAKRGASKYNIESSVYASALKLKPPHIYTNVLPCGLTTDQKEILDCPKAIIVKCKNRRGGKGTVAGQWLCMNAIRQPSFNGWFYPTFSQGHKCLFEGVSHDGRPILDTMFVPCLVRGIRRSEGSVDFINESSMDLFGCEVGRGKRSVGLNHKNIVMSEFAKIKNGLEIYNYQLKPMLLLTNGKILIESTMEGYDDFYEMLQIAATDPENCHSIIVTARDSLTEAAQWQIIREGRHDHAATLREFYCDPNAFSTKESVYGDLLIDKKLHENLGDITKPIFTGWDLGEGCRTAIWFMQIINNQPQLIWYYENRGKDDIQYYGNIVKDFVQQFPAEITYLPWDANVHYGYRNTRAQLLREIGLNVKVVKRTRLVSTEVDRARVWICKSDIQFAAAARAGFTRLVQYKWAHRDGIQQNKFVDHDGSKDTADAFRVIFNIFSRPELNPTHIIDWKSSQYGTFPEHLLCHDSFRHTVDDMMIKDHKEEYYDSHNLQYPDITHHIWT